MTFRLSHEEFRDFRKICIDEGFGSLSELLRAAVQELIANRQVCSPEALQRSPEALHAAIERLNTRMEELDRDVKQLRTSSTEVTA